jgi:3-oxoacyl-[acyl-carrier-protein] synthase-1
MVTAVGGSAPATCTAIRSAIDHFVETRFVDRGGAWIVGSPVPLERPWRGLQKLVHMLVPAIRECLREVPPEAMPGIPLLLCMAERTRPGRLSGLEEELFGSVESELGIRFHAQSRVIPAGRVGVALAVGLARDLIHREGRRYCLVAGADSYLQTGTLDAYDTGSRILSERNSNGFVPGEGAAAVLLQAPSSRGPELVCLGVGLGHERATLDSELPIRADGMVDAIRKAQADAGVTIAETDYRLTDLNCEQYGFREAVLAFNRVLRVRKENHELWHPADCIGEVGAAVGPCVIGLALVAARKGYAPGPGVLCHFSNDDGKRAAMILRHGERA